MVGLVEKDQYLDPSLAHANSWNDIWTTCVRPVRNFIPSFIHRKCTWKRTGKHTGFSTSPCQGSQQVRIVFGHALFRAPKLLDSFAGVQHRRVIAAAERVADFRKT